MKPSIGRIVHYALTDHEAEAVNRRRKDFHESRGAAERTGFVGHVGNWAKGATSSPR